MVTINNKFDGIEIGDQKQESKSKINIRHSHNPLYYIIGCVPPVAVVDCGECKTQYKEKIFYQFGRSFSMDKELTCPKCNHKDNLSYSKQ